MIIFQSKGGFWRRYQLEVIYSPTQLYFLNFMKIYYMKVTMDTFMDPNTSEMSYDSEFNLEVWVKEISVMVRNRFTSTYLV